MKKFLSILLVALIATAVIQAQEATNYLTKAFELLLKGNIESAEKHYIVHKKITGQTDAEFEAMLENEKSTTTSWKDECYIVDFNNEYALAIQKKSISEKTDTWYDAQRKAKDSRIGGFMDWRLPTIEELSVILANTDKITVYRNRTYCNLYWSTSYTKDSYKGNKIINNISWLKDRFKSSKKVDVTTVDLLNATGEKYVDREMKAFYSDGSIGCKSLSEANYIIVRKFKK